MNEQSLLRLGRSLIAQKADRLVSVDHAADALLAALIEMPGNLPPKVQRHLAPMIRNEVELMAKGAVFACEIVNYHLHVGCIYSVGLYQPETPAVDQQSELVRFCIGFNGRTYKNVGPITARTIETLTRIAKGNGR